MLSCEDFCKERIDYFNEVRLAVMTMNANKLSDLLDMGSEFENIGKAKLIENLKVRFQRPTSFRKLLSTFTF